MVSEARNIEGHSLYLENVIFRISLSIQISNLSKEICLNQRGIVLSNSDDILFGDKCAGVTRAGDVWRSSTNEIDFYSNSIAAADRL
jgi:hypothetical protein